MLLPYSHRAALTQRPVSFRGGDDEMLDYWTAESVRDSLKGARDE